MTAAIVLSACLDSGSAQTPRADTPSPEPTAASTEPPPRTTPISPLEPAPKATETPAAVSTREAFPSAAWNSLGATELTFMLSGGIAGFARRLSIDASARVRVEDQRNGRVRETTLSAGDAAALSSVLDRSAFYAQAASQRARCVDCFDYVLTLTGPSGTHSVSANNLGLDARLVPLVEWLTSLQQRELE